MKYLIIFMLLWTGTNLSAQNLSGFIKDQHGQPLSSCSIFLFAISSDSTILSVASDELGSFKLHVDQPGNYYIKIRSLGYKTYIKEITNINFNMPLAIILEKNEEQIEEVQVTAKKKFIERKLDRLSIQISDNPSATGKSATELFKMAPGVFYANESISINGTYGAQVMINGRKLNLSGKDLKTYLDNLKASEIESIEIMAHPSSEFDASGIAGIIHIKLKKNRTEGLVGDVAFHYGTGLGKYPNYNPSASINYKNKNFEVSANYFFNQEKSYTDLNQFRLFAKKGLFSNTMNSIQYQKTHNLKLATTYFISNKSDIALSFNNNWNDYFDDIKSYSSITFPITTDNILSSGKFPSSSKTQLPSIGLNFSHKLDTLGSALKFSTDYLYMDKKAKSSVFSSTRSAMGLNQSDTSYTFNFPNSSKLLTSEASFEQYFSPHFSIYTGTKVAITRIDNDNFFEVYQQNNWQQTPEKNFSYLYDENIYAAFLNMQGMINNYQYKIGIRAEKSDIKGFLDAPTDKQNIENNYLNFFPSISISKSILEEKANLHLVYNKRIQRPSYLQLNPYKYYIDSYSLEEGNPYLKPEISHQLEFAFQFQKFNASLGYSNTNNMINTVIQTDNNSPIMIIQNQNVAKSTVWNANFSYETDIFDWWHSSNNLLLTQTKSSSPSFNINLNSFILQSQQDFKLNKRLDFNISAFYSPAVSEGNFITEPISSVDLGLNLKLMNNKLQLKAAITDIFYTQHIKGKSYFNEQVLELNQRNQTRKLSLGILYNFNFGKSFSKKDISSSNSNEQDRLK